METEKGRNTEDRFTRAIEQRTSQVPSTTYLGLAIGSMVLSATFKLMRKDELALFVGQWAAPFLVVGIYNKMVKQHGSDATDSPKIGSANLGQAA
jgi:hypothetical protein